MISYYFFKKKIWKISIVIHYILIPKITEFSVAISKRFNDIRWDASLHILVSSISQIIRRIGYLFIYLSKALELFFFSIPGKNSHEFNEKKNNLEQAQAGRFMETFKLEEETRRWKPNISSLSCREPGVASHSSSVSINKKKTATTFPQKSIPLVLWHRKETLSLLSLVVIIVKHLLNHRLQSNWS